MSTTDTPTDSADRVLTRQGQDRRDELLAHAERLFLEHGVANTRMVDIAASAGVAKGLVYWYFDGKDALLLAIVLDVRERLRAAQIDAIADVEPVLDRLYLGTVESVRFIDQHWNLYRLLQTQATDEAQASAFAESSQVHALDTHLILEEGRADGSVRADEELLVMAQANQGVVNHFALSAQRGLFPDVEAAAHAAARLVVHVAAATPELAAASIDRCITSRPRPTTASR